MSDRAVIAERTTSNGVRIRTTLTRGQYVTESIFEGVIIGRAVNVDPFHAGEAQMAFHISWSEASESNLRQEKADAFADRVPPTCPECNRPMEPMPSGALPFSRFECC